MKLPEFKQIAESLLEQLQDHINTNMSQKGLISEECQRVYLTQQVSEVEHAINGTTDADLVEKEDC